MAGGIQSEKASKLVWLFVGGRRQTPAGRPLVEKSWLVFGGFWLPTGTSCQCTYMHYTKPFMLVPNT